MRQLTARVFLLRPGHTCYLGACGAPESTLLLVFFAVLSLLFFAVLLQSLQLRLRFRCGFVLFMRDGVCFATLRHSVPGIG